VSNLKQLGLAFHTYLTDFDDCFPAAEGGTLSEDWIYYNPQSAGPMLKSPIFPYVSGTTNLLSCPADRSKPPTNTAGAYPFNYTLNDGNGSFGTYLPSLNRQSIHPMQGQVIFGPSRTSLGMASPYQRGPSEHFRMGMVRAPSRKIMLAEEAKFPMSGLSSFGGGSISFADADGSSWRPDDAISIFHRKKGVTCAADGHVEKFTPTEASDPNHSHATFE
jgi:hypothetical protein